VQRVLFFSKHAWNVHRHQLPSTISKYKTKSTRASKENVEALKKQKKNEPDFSGRDEMNQISSQIHILQGFLLPFFLVGCCKPVMHPLTT